MKIVKFECIFNQKIYCTHDIFSDEIRTAQLEIPTTHFMLQNTLF